MLKKISQYHKYIMRFSLSTYFLLFTTVFICLFAFFTILISVSDYQAYKSNQKQELEDNAIKIQGKLTSLFDTISHIQAFMGKQIVNHGSHDLSYILNLFKNHNEVINHASIFYSWDLYDWVDPSLRVLITSKLGIIKPVDLTHRVYLQETKRTPWVLCISTPIKGYFSGEPVLGIGMGISDKKRKHLGSIIVGVNIKQLTQKLSTDIKSNKIHFAMINQKGEIIISSDKNIVGLQSSINRNDISKKLQNVFSSEGILAHHIENEDIIYSHFRKITDYPYYLLVGFDAHIATQEILTLLRPQILEFLVLSSICFLLLAFFKYWFIKPVQDLARQAINLIQAKPKFHQSYIKSTEFFNLSKALIFIRRHLQYNQQIQKKLELSNQYLKITNNELSKNQKLLETAQKKLEKVINIATESDFAKEEFLAQVNADLKSSLNTILDSTNYLSEMVSNELDSSMKNLQLKEIQTIYQAVCELKAYTRIVLKLEMIYIKDIIEDCLKIHKKIIFDKQINIKLYFKKDLSLIYADKFRLTQALVGLLYKAIHNSTSGGVVKIKSANLIINENNYIKIEIEDNGFGLSEHDVKRLKENFSNITGACMMELELETIKQLIELHGGMMEVAVDFGKGTKVTILLPVKHLKTKKFSELEALQPENA